MTETANIQQLLTNLQNQIAGITGNYVAPIPTPAPQPVPDINTMIKNAVQEEIQKLSQHKKDEPLVLPPTNGIQPQQLLNLLTNNNPILSLIPIIGAAFTLDQQEWISQPENLNRIPNFLQSKEGKTLLQMSLESYQQYLTNA